MVHPPPHFIFHWPWAFSTPKIHKTWFIWAHVPNSLSKSFSTMNCTLQREGGGCACVYYIPYIHLLLKKSMKSNVWIVYMLLHKFKSMDTRIPNFIVMNAIDKFIFIRTPNSQWSVPTWEGAKKKRVDRLIRITSHTSQGLWLCDC
jgi:hypothetical protein